LGRQSKYPEEFRRETVRLVLSTDKSMAEVARDLGINYKTLGNWVRSDKYPKIEMPNPGHQRERAHRTPAAALREQGAQGSTPG
jgi:transposase-like protein